MARQLLKLRLPPLIAGDTYRWDGQQTVRPVPGDGLIVAGPDGQPGFEPRAEPFRIWFSEGGVAPEVLREFVIHENGQATPGSEPKEVPGDNDDTNPIVTLAVATANGNETTDIIVAGGYQAYNVPAVDPALPAETLVVQLVNGTYEHRRKTEPTEPKWGFGDLLRQVADQANTEPRWVMGDLLRQIADSATLAAPGLSLTITSLTTATLILTDPNTSETGTRFEMAVDGGGWTFLVGTGANITAQPLTGMEAGKVYSYRARAERSSDGAVSPWSNTATRRVPRLTISFALYGQGNPPGSIANLSNGSRIQTPGPGNLGMIVRQNGGDPASDDFTGVGLVVAFPDGTTGGFPGPEGSAQAGAYWAFPRPDGRALPAGSYEVRGRLYSGSTVLIEEVIRFVFTPPGNVPLPPAGLNAFAEGAKTLLTWSDKSDNEDVFEIESAAPGTDTWGWVGVVGQNVTRDTVDIAPTAGTRFRIRGKNSFGDSPYSNIAQLSASNQNPTLPAVEDQAGAAGVGLSIQLPTGSDADGDTLSYTLAGLPSGLSFNDQTRRITGSAGVGTYTLTYSVSDGHGGSTNTGFRLVLSKANRAPSVPALQDLTLYTHFDYGQEAGSPIQLPAGTDPDGDSLTRTVQGAPTGLIFNPQALTLSGYVAAANAGTYNLTYTVTDPSDASASSQARYTVLKTRITRLEMNFQMANGVAQLAFRAIAVLPASDTLSIALSYLGSNGNISWNADAGPGGGNYTLMATTSQSGVVAGGSLQLIFWFGSTRRYPEDYRFLDITITLPQPSASWVTIHTEP